MHEQRCGCVVKADMAEYSIKDLENFTGIKAHTLRIWEQRYNLLEPNRTPTNIRYYTDRDLKKILNVNLLYNNGYKISKIACMSGDQIIEKATELLYSQPESSDDHIEYFIRMIIELDEPAIMERMNAINEQVGVIEFYTGTMIPLLQRIGELWQLDTITVSHEHFFSNILRDFFIRETSKIASPIAAKGRVVLFLHEREMHELSLLFYYYVLKSRNYECYYLGQAVPVADLISFIKQMRPDFLFTSFIAETDPEFIQDFMAKILAIHPAKKIYVGGYQAMHHKQAMPADIHFIHSTDDIKL